MSSSPGGRIATDASFTVLPDNSQFLVGTFANPGSLSLSLGSVANILAAGGWSQFGSAQSISTNTIGGNHPGKVQGGPIDTSSNATFFNGKAVYLVVFNTTSAATATQMGIFYTSLGSPTSWVFPTNGTVGDSASLAMDDTSIGAVGGVGSTTSSPQRFVLGTIVPEPTAFALLAPGMIGLLGYRRLRRLG